jgi:enoyl-CoA hydratase
MNPSAPLPPLTCFSLSTTNHIAHLVLNRPEAMNTMHPTFWRELDAVLVQLHKAGDARVLVISSTGKHFSAGMALETFSSSIAMDDQSPEGRAAIFDLLTDMQSTFTRLENLRIPVIAAIQGGCIGGAVDMVTACCLRYATLDAFFCIQEINIGMVADVGTLQRLPKLIPEAVVKELAYTGRRLGAAKAMGYGLVNEVFESADAMLTAALQCAKEIAAKPPVAIWGTKQAIHYTRDHPVEDALKQMGWLQAAIWSNQHVREAVTAMKEKRAGEFTPLSPLTYFKENGL